ncbi:tetratricopeptide repeat protein [Streptomyces kaniharaensis]|uniref:tetratricopeptide repeat protein n=1 Tax=Streptomyces kaniharaensis TaxID=212423 RepID=UPI0018A84C68|nr:tetratricopeptide repeat protein [Streptomyces kaniharaensis]
MARSAAGRGEDSDEGEVLIANLLGLLHARPDDLAVRRELGFELTGAECWEVAVEVLSPAVELAPRDADVRLDLGCALSALERWADAEEQLTKAVALSPGLACTYAELGYVLLCQQRLEEAGIASHKALVHDPGSALGHLCLAEVLQTARTRAGDVATHARVAVDAWPDSAWGHAVLAQALLDTGDYGGAHQAASRAHELDPGSDRAAQLLCWALGELQRWREAVRAAEQAAARKATPWTLNALGWALIGRGHLHAAEQVLRRAVALDPAVRICRWNLAWLLARVGRMREAEANLTVLLHHDRDDGQALGLLGWIHLASGRGEQAREELRRAVRLLGTTRTAARPLLLIGALERAENPPLARRYFLAATAVADRLPSPDIYSHPCGTGEIQALAFAALGEGDRARQCLEQALAARDGSDRFDPRLYEQFTQPPLPGLDVLIRLWKDP